MRIIWHPRPVVRDGERPFNFSGRCSGTTGLQLLERVTIEGHYSAGDDVFAVLPTVYWKILCYACLPFLFDHLHQFEEPQKSVVVVVTPLTAIMEDQASWFPNPGSFLVIQRFVCFCNKLKHYSYCKSWYFQWKEQLNFFTPEVLLQKRRWRDLLNSSMYTD